MADNTPGDKNDTSEYSASKAPETKVNAEERDAVHDPRLQPGGRHGTPVDPGMASLNRDDVPGKARDTTKG